MAGALEKSGEVMKYMQHLVKVPEIQATMQEMSKEMMKVRLIELMKEDITMHACRVALEPARSPCMADASNMLSSPQRYYNKM